MKASPEDFFSKYVFEYLAFIAYLKTQLYVGNNETDRKTIQRLKRDNLYKNQYINKINSNNNLNISWTKIQTELNRTRLGRINNDMNQTLEVEWWNCSHEELNDKTVEENQKIKGVIHSLEDWENMVEFWYTIRNNLFHGAKNPADDRDKLLVEYAYKTLRPFMTMCLTNR
jgi:hypothetical protein